VVLRHLDKILNYSFSWGLKVDLEVRKWYHTIVWWELRRIPYNIMMACIGVLSLILGLVTTPLFYLLIGLGLNIYFTQGWMHEILGGRNTEEGYAKNTFLKITRNSIVVILIPSLFFAGIALVNIALFLVRDF
jgi:hypothetical protein